MGGDTDQGTGQGSGTFKESKVSVNDSNIVPQALDRST